MRLITKVAVLLAVVVGCRQNDIEPVTTVTGSLNGNSWQQSGWTFKGGVYNTRGINTKVCKLNTLDIILTRHNPQGFERENLFIAKIPPRVGSYNVRNIYDCDVNADVGANFYLLGADGDVLTAVFNVVESARNVLTIERIDSSTRQLSGHLQLTLATTPQQRSRFTPYDTVRITDCRFTLPITGQ